MQNPSILKVSFNVVQGSSSEKFLGITIDSNFTFEKHINELIYLFIYSLFIADLQLMK